MRGGQWQAVQQLFHAALNLPDTEREPWLNAQVVPDTIRSEVHSLLTALEQHEQFCEADFAEHDVAAGQELTGQHLIGRLCGPYRLVRLIVGGGMGWVFEAVRHSPEFKQRAAVKITPALFGMPAVERFRQEKQILAGLNHAGIAHLLDGGITQQGLSYLAMEFVDGEAISVYVRRKALTEREIILLILQVCDAVAYAHNGRVVHRDIKPGNILVTEQGTVKLLDFGIAKLLDQDENGSVTAWRAHTPRYASPEQLRGESAGPASDIYQIGVVLAELLTSAPTDQRFPAKIGTRASGNRSPNLEAIIGKAASKEPDQRYASASVLADDLKRYLAGEPVTARRGAILSRFPFGGMPYAFKSARRMAAMLLAFALATGGFWFTRYESERTRSERRDALYRVFRDAAGPLSAAEQDPADMAITRTTLQNLRESFEAALRADPQDSRLLELLGNTMAKSAVVAWARYEPSLTNVSAAYSDQVRAIKYYEDLAPKYPSREMLLLNARVGLEDLLIEKGRGADAFADAIQVIRAVEAKSPQADVAGYIGEDYDKLSDKLGAANPWVVEEFSGSWKKLAAFRPYLLTDRLAAGAYEQCVRVNRDSARLGLVEVQLGRLELESGDHAKGFAVLLEARRSFEVLRDSNSGATVQRWIDFHDFTLCRALQVDGRYREAAQACKPAIANAELRASRRPQIRYLQQRLAHSELMYAALLSKLGNRTEAEHRVQFGLKMIRADLQLPGAPSYFLDWAAQAFLTVNPHRFRDNELAITSAEKAVQVSAGQVPSYLITLAIAQHACGKEAIAADTARQAVARQTRVLEMMKPFAEETAESKRIYQDLRDQLEQLQAQFASRPSVTSLQY